MKTLLVIDANSIINRAYYGVAPLSTRDGFHTNAIYGMINILTAHQSRYSPDYIAAAFDLHAPTFRHKMYAEYKAGRHPTPPELIEQFPVAKDCLRALGYAVIEKEGYEADDILGTLAATAEARGDIQTYLLTGDRDSFQLIAPRTSVLYASKGETAVFDEKAFTDKYGIPSSLFVDVKALMGDSSDNIPGIAGIGEKTALKLISEFGGLDGVFEALPNAKHPPALRAKLEGGRESAEFSRTLATIDRSVPLGITLDDIEYKGRDDDALSSLFTRLEFDKLTVKLGIGRKSRLTADTADTAASLTAEEILSALRGKPFAFVLSDASLSAFDGEKTYNYSGALAPLAPLFSDTAYSPVCHDLKSCAALLDTQGIEFSNCAFDVMLAAYVLNSAEKSFGLEALATAYAVAPASPPAVVFELYEEMNKKLTAENSLDLLTNIEQPVALVLHEMEERGFLIDREGLAEYGKQLEAEEGELAERIYFLAGCEFNINSPKQLGEILFERLSLPAPKKTKSGFSTASDVLQKLRPYHPIISEVLDYRRVAKLRSTYVVGLLAVADAGGRVHTSFNQCVTATGRLSSTEPNLQNIPIRTEQGRRLRRYFIPDAKGRVLIDADYSQIELRLLASISGDEAMCGAFARGEDIHASTAAAVFGLPLEAVTPELRKRAKAVNFGIVYGIGAFSLAADLSIPRAEAQRYIESYLARYPKIEGYLKSVVAEAKENGYVTTIFGRRRYIPELKNSNKMLQAFGERVAMNSPIQGSAADIIKLAMANTAKKLSEAGLDAHLILQVHDELIVESAAECAERATEILRYEMEHAVSLAVPLPVDISTGETWFDNR